MIESKFRIDLGQGDFIDVGIEREIKYTLNDLLDDIKKDEKWLTFGDNPDTAIRKSSIKRIIVLQN